MAPNYALFWVDPRCFWCRNPVRIVRQTSCYRNRLPEDAATIDHLYARKNKLRNKVLKTHGRGLTVVSCYRCNHERGKCQAVTHTELWNHIKYDGLPIY